MAKVPEINSRGKVIVITGRKGGIGKTTLSGNLAVEMVAAGKRVALLDADPQASLTAWAGFGDGVLAQIVTAAPLEHRQKFRDVIEKATASADYVVIDTPPGFADQALIAAIRADLIVLPIGPSPLDLVAAKDALALVRQVRDSRPDQALKIRLAPSKIVKRTRLGAETVEALDSLGEPVLPPITQRAAVAEATLAGLSVREFSKASPSVAEFEKICSAILEALDGKS